MLCVFVYVYGLHIGSFVFWMYCLPPDPECVFKLLYLSLEKDENDLEIKSLKKRKEKKATLDVPEVEDDERLFPHLGGADEVDEGVFPGRLGLLVKAAGLEEHQG